MILKFDNARVETIIWNQPRLQVTTGLEFKNVGMDEFLKELYGKKMLKFCWVFAKKIGITSINYSNQITLESTFWENMHKYNSNIISNRILSKEVHPLITVAPILKSMHVNDSYVHVKKSCILKQFIMK